MSDRNTPDRATSRDAMSIAWEVVSLVAYLVLTMALAVAIVQGRVTESVAIALLIMFRGFLALRR